MRLLQKIPQHQRKFLRELVTFGLVGGVNTIFGFAIFNLLFGMGSLTANAISTAAATVVSFVLNRHITYRDRLRTPLRRELPMFAAFNLVGLGIQQAVMALAKAAFDLHETARLEFNLVRVVSVGLGTIFLLLSYRTFVFKRVPVVLAAPPAASAPAAIPEPAAVPGPAVTPEPAAVPGPAMVPAPRVSATAMVPAPGGTVPATVPAPGVTVPAQAAADGATVPVAVPVSAPPSDGVDAFDGPEDPFSGEVTEDLELDEMLGDEAVRSTL